MLFEENKDQLNLFHSEAEEALDIVAELLSAMSHTGMTDNVYESEQTAVWMRKLKDHPAYKDALKRKRSRFLQHLARCKKEVDSWPPWMKISISGR